MKKILLLAVFTVFISNAFGQKITDSKIDDFTGERVIYTSWETINGGNIATGKDNLAFRFRYEHGTVFFHLSWVTVDYVSIDEGDKLIFKMSNNQNVTINTVRHAVGGKGEARMVEIVGVTPVYSGDFSAFESDAYMTKFRIYAKNNYTDFDIKEKNALKINKAYKLLKAEIAK